MRFCKLAVFVSILIFCLNAGFCQNSELNILSQANEFKATPDAIGADQRPRLIDQVSGITANQGNSNDIADAYSKIKKGKNNIFRIAGNPPDNRTMRWECLVSQMDTVKVQYYLIRYKAHGQRREYNPFAVISISGLNEKGEKVNMPLLDCSEVINDNNWHVVLGKKNIGFNINSIIVQLGTQGTDAVLEIDTCVFSESLPNVSSYLSQKTPAKISKNEFSFVDISKLFNDNYASSLERSLNKYEKVADSANLFSNPVVSINGASFAVGTSGKNIIVPPSDSNANSGTVTVMGAELAKSNYKRVAREDSIKVKIGKKANEVYFVLVSEMPPTLGRYSLPKIPTQFFSNDSFTVELLYSDGISDFAFPYSLADKGHTIQRGVGAYAVTADRNRVLKFVIFHNRYYGASFNLAALTLNTGKMSLIPNSITNPEIYRVASVKRPVKKSVKISKIGKIYKLENSDYLIEIDCNNGFEISKLAHKWSTKSKIAIGKGSGIEINIGDKIITGNDFNIEKADINGNKLNIDMNCKDVNTPLNIKLIISGNDSNQISFDAQITNTGSKTFDANLRFPVIKGLSIGKLHDTWLYFPQCRNINSKDFGTYIAPNDRSYVMQFYDIYNPEDGIGISIMTHNLKNAILDYSLRKSAAGVEAFVQYPISYNKIEAGATNKLVQTNIVFHGGDWHQALAAYSDWKDTWYKPVKADNLDWWYKSFIARGHMTARSYSWAVPMYDPVKNTYLVDEILKEDESYLGSKPDIYHMGGWIDYNNLFAGDFLGGDYAVENITGGLDVFKSAINKMKSENIKVSVYSIPDRCAKNSKIGQEMGAKFALVNADGSLSQSDNQWYLCLGVAGLQDHYVEVLKKVQQATGVNAVYVDVFGYANASTCYSKEHGHALPCNMNVANYQLISKLRDALPDGVAIWSEYQLNDDNSQYISGNIAYYYLTLHEYFVKSYDILDRSPGFTPVVQSSHRFIFPNLKQFGFPVGFENSPTSYDLQALFFNGEGLLDVGFLLYDSRELVRVSNWLAIQKKYADCFASKTPVPLVATIAGEIYANKFPGDGRTAWTIFNTRFSTYRGQVITVNHNSGDTYYDAWNKKPIKPLIKGNKATLSIDIDPQGLGCIVKTSK